MGKFDKFKNILKTGSTVGSILTGGRAKSVLDIVNQTIEDKTDPKNEQALRDIAEINDAQTDVLRDHEARLKKLEARL